MNIVEYKETFGELELSEAFMHALQGKTIEEQMTHYRITTTSTLGSTSYGEVDKSSQFCRTFAL